MMEQNRKTWNENQKEFQRLLSPSGDFRAAIPLFLSQHAAVHSAQLSRVGLWSFPDEMLQGLADPDLRRIPPGGEHSIAWVLWHLARIEDVTMNILVAGRPQLYYEENWFTQMKFLSSETGNALDQAGDASLSSCLDLEALHAYRLAVGRRTQLVVKALHPDDLQRRVPPSRLDQVLAEGAVVESTRSLLDYWSKRTIAGLLLMPPTRHNFLHLNEASHIRQKIIRSGV
ncbi:MAG TPA: DinB family protein [Anaerolineales bacterium]